MEKSKGNERQPEVYKDERLPLFVPLFLSSYYIRNNETQYPARNGRRRMAEDRRERREKEKRERRLRVSLSWFSLGGKPSATTMELALYQSAPVATLLNVGINNKFRP